MERYVIDDDVDLPWPEMTRREAERDAERFRPAPRTPEDEREIREAFREMMPEELRYLYAPRR